MAITMIDPVEVKAKSFEESHLYNKMRKMVVVARTFVDKNESSAVVYSVGSTSPKFRLVAESVAYSNIPTI
jgi:hypothetical protein